MFSGCRSISKDPTQSGYFSAYRVTKYKSANNVSNSLTIKVLDVFTNESIESAAYYLNHTLIERSNTNGYFFTQFYRGEPLKAEVWITSPFHYFADVRPIKVNRADSVVLEVYLKPYEGAIQDPMENRYGKGYEMKNKLK